MTNNIDQISKNILSMLVDGKVLQIMKAGENLWRDFQGVKHGDLIFNNESRFRIKPESKPYYYARFDDGSMSGLFDSIDKAEVSAFSEVKGEFSVVKLIPDLSFNYEADNND